ncbi:hypothetical protein [Metabacillus niabensis]|uniref:hypothetical protein n=1 Tax=Metabacillus niabensis TaxID=324854 RepID=UPI001CFAB01D|nr:hypothetical protein [Metabacillus niabensis]
MDSRIKELIDRTKEKFGLHNYYLQTHELYRRVNFFSDTVYTLCMEWFPNRETVEKDGSNPEGAAVIEIDLHTQKFTSAIFVSGKTYAHNGVSFANFTNNDIIKWIKQETGLVYEKHFKLRREEERELHFVECIDGISVSPSGYIEVHYDEDRKLTFFSNHGHYPSKEMVLDETYSLTFEKIEQLAKEQVQLLEYPSYEQERLFPLFAVEEIYIRNDQSYTIPFELFVDVNSYQEINQTIFWDEPLKQTFDQKELNWHDEVSIEQAYAAEPSPDSFPITKDEKEKCILGVKELLRQEYSNESGMWVLKTLHREKGYIHAMLRAKKQDKRVFQKKLMLMIDPENFQVVNYMDNQFMLELFDEFQAPDKITIEKEEAFEKLKDLFELKPYYVYDFDKKRYVLCGKVDCEYSVNASTGEVMMLDNL